jgi:hypothetical protein
LSHPVDRPAVFAALLLALDPAVGCAQRTDDETRAAFEGLRAPSDDRRGGRRARTERRAARAQAAADPWQPVHDVLGESIALLGLGPDEAAVIELAKRRCAVEPAPKATEAGPTYVCFPEPAVEVGGHVFTLELAPSGVIGLQAADLSGDSSRSLVEQVRQATARHCASPFHALDPEPSDERAAQFHICPVDGGSTLAVGRAPEGRDRWFVSVAVLAPG